MSTAPLPEPPYPRDVRSGSASFHVDMGRIMQSDTWLLTPADVRPWLLMLWVLSWTRLPCGSYPDDDEVIAATIGMPPALFQAHRKTLMRGWRRHADGRLYHPVVTELVVAMLRGRQKWADYKKGKRVTNNQEVATNVHVESGRSPPHVSGCSGSGSGSGSGKPPPTRDVLPRGGAGGGKVETPPPVDNSDPVDNFALVPVSPMPALPLPAGLPPLEWQAFKLHRKAMKKPLSLDGEHRNLRELAKLVAQGEDPVAVIDQSIRMGWQGLFPVGSSGPAAARAPKESHVAATMRRVKERLAGAGQKEDDE